MTVRPWSASVWLVPILIGACATSSSSVRTGFDLVPLVAGAGGPGATVRLGTAIYRVPAACLCARLAGGADEGRLAGGADEGRLSGGGNEGRLAGGDSEGRMNGGANEGRMNGGADEGRLSGGGSEGRLAAGDSEGRLAGGGGVGPACRTNNDLCGFILLADGTPLRTE